jgi:DNA polymerase III delta subunit
MAVEPAIGFLRSLARPREIPAAVLITGPNQFLREYVLEALARTLRAQGCKYRSFQVSDDEDLAAMLHELRAPDMFRPRRLAACRVLKNVREAPDDAEARPSAGRGKSSGVEASLIEAIGGLRGAESRLAIIYERDNAPAKLRRAAEQSGLAITCMRPFDDQLGQYATLFARLADCRLAPEAADLLAGGFTGDLGGMANAVAIAALGHQAGAVLKPGDFATDTSGRAPELFAISEAIGRADLLAALGMLDRAMAVGRDALEILGVEIVPTLRRMMVAAALLGAGKSVSGVAAALGMAPGSPMAARAVDGARRYGADRLRRAYQAACGLDASIKAGLTSETREALARLLIDLAAEPAPQ